MTPWGLNVSHNNPFPPDFGEKLKTFEIEERTFSPVA